jgi:hypothetical protein
VREHPKEGSDLAAWCERFEDTFVTNAPCGLSGGWEWLR